MDRQTVALLILAAIAVYLVMNQKKGGYAMMGQTSTAGNKMYMDGYPLDQTSEQSYPGLPDLSSSMIPREVSTDEKFGDFSPDSVLSGQNFLDPRQQIGYPETIGGNLRNANRQERSEPPNPRVFPSPWNMSTIPPDLMRPAFEIGSGTF
jgi:hypothetical protein